MTDEERQKYKEYQKNYRKNMSDEGVVEVYGVCYIPLL